MNVERDKTLQYSSLPMRRDIGLKKRYRQEYRFRFYGIFAIFIGLFFLFLLLFSVISKGYTAFWQTSLTLPIYYDEKIIDPNKQHFSHIEEIRRSDYRKLITNALIKELGLKNPDDQTLKKLRHFFSMTAAAEISREIFKHPEKINHTEKRTFLVSADIDSAFKGQIDLSVAENYRKVSDQEVSWMKTLFARGLLEKKFNYKIFTSPPSSHPESSGLGVALLGSLYLMGIVLFLAVPIGVSAAIYLEEYAKKNFFSSFLEVNINNLAAVPSIVFGLLGLSFFINFLGMPYSSSLVGGFVLVLMTLPTIIITTRAALRNVPSSIRAAAFALGASKTQVIFHHVLPLGLPAILTGTIIGLAQALGETAPLILIGMVAFIGNYPVTPMDPATTLSVQIYIWANEVERAFVERTSAAIIVLLLFLAIMNITAIFLRRRFERRW